MENKDSAVQLLKEWKAAKDAHSDAAFLLQAGIGKPDESLDSLLGIIDGLSRRLDKIAEAVGIFLSDKGNFWYKDMKVSVEKFPWAMLNLPAREQQAIQEWLLIKNEEKTA